MRPDLTASRLPPGPEGARVPMWLVPSSQGTLCKPPNHPGSLPRGGGGTRRGPGDKTPLEMQPQPCTGIVGGGAAAARPWCAPCLGRSSATQSPGGQEGRWAWAALQPSAHAGASPQGRREGLGPSCGLLVTGWDPRRACSQGGRTTPLWGRVAGGSTATTRSDASVCPGTRCDEERPPGPSWSPHCRFSESAGAPCSLGSQTVGEAG